MARRILAGGMAVLAVFAFPSERAGSAPAPTTTATTAPGTAEVPPDSPANPLTIYPRRPGARYSDAEARSGQALTIASTPVNVVRSAIEPRTSLPADLRSADPAPYERLGLVDGYAPSTTHTTGDLLHVVIHVKSSFAQVTCVATRASDGTTLVPYSRRPARPRAPVSSTSTTTATSTSTTTSTAALPGATTDFDVDFYFPIGAQRGRVYLVCAGTLGGRFIDLVGILGNTRGVWALDV